MSKLEEIIKAADEDLECPECGSPYFHSTFVENGTEDGAMIRHCDGMGESWQCNFQWHEKDDEKYTVIKISKSVLLEIIQ